MPRDSCERCLERSQWGERGDSNPRHPGPQQCCPAAKDVEALCFMGFRIADGHHRTRREPLETRSSAPLWPHSRSPLSTEFRPRSLARSRPSGETETTCQRSRPKLKGEWRTADSVGTPPVKDVGEPCAENRDRGERITSITSPAESAWLRAAFRWSRGRMQIVLSARTRPHTAAQP